MVIQKMIGTEDYPYNLLIAARGDKMLALPLSLTKDVQAGITYALSTLEKSERDALDKKYRLGEPLCDAQQQAEKKALIKLRKPCRWDYICCGIVGCSKKKAAEATRKGFAKGYLVGYAAGTKATCTGNNPPEPAEILDRPIEIMPLPARVYNALDRKGYRTIRDIITLDIDEISRIRNLGIKGIQEIAEVLRSYDIMHTAWETF